MGLFHQTYTFSMAILMLLSRQSLAFSISKSTRSYCATATATASTATIHRTRPTTTGITSLPRVSALSAHDDNNPSHCNSHSHSNTSFHISVAAAVAATGVFASILFPGTAFADEYGTEVEAPTLLTGETVEICVKRGPLGACQKTERRTAENDNDKSTKYFRDPAEKLKEKYSAAQLQSVGSAPDASSEGNELIEKLRQASLDNKERNDRIVRAKTLQNDLGASFGPLDNQVVILNTDGESFTLLKAPQAMRLKKAGYIKDKRFVTQPTQEVIDEALEAPEGGGISSFFKGLLGGSDGGASE